MPWRDRAACLDENPELFFPVGTGRDARLQIKWAREVCRRCEVVETCLKWAVDNGQDAGVLGGMTEDERHAFRHRGDRTRGAHRAASSLW